ncbi:MAG TPA: histidine kinase [Chitinophagaceae bacterium]|nr:histidine kinase [Chitinophagaceae bacterium]
MKPALVEKKWVQEVLILIASFILITLNGWRNINDFETAIQALLYFGILYAHAIIHRFILLPLFFNKRYPAYILCSVALALAFSTLLYFTGIYWMSKWIEILKVNDFEIFIYHAGTCVLSLVAILGGFILLSLYNDRKKQTSLQLAINEMELKILHSQLNPAFLHNTFNRLYNISLNDSGRVPELIMELSKLMRYHVESYVRDFVPLEDELAFIESYIAFEEERVSENCTVNYNYTNNNKNSKYMLPPLLLIPFIENAFKHGINSAEKSVIYLSIEVKNEELYMEAENTIPKIRNSFSRSTGIGIKNIEKRLELLYGEKYKLFVEHTPSQYKVSLVLPLVKSPV